MGGVKSYKIKKKVKATPENIRMLKNFGLREVKGKLGDTWEDGQYKVQKGYITDAAVIASNISYKSEFEKAAKKHKIPLKRF